MTDPTEPRWLTHLRAAARDQGQCLNIERASVQALLDNRDRHEELRRQTEAVCERRTAEREEILTQVNALRTELLYAQAERDESRLELCRKTFELGADLPPQFASSPAEQPRPAVLVTPAPGRAPVWCSSPREVAIAWGWGYLYPCESCGGTRGAGNAEWIVWNDNGCEGPQPVSCQTCGEIAPSVVEPGGEL